MCKKLQNFSSNFYHEQRCKRNKTVLENSKNKKKKRNLQKHKPRPKVLMDMDYPNASGALD
jgi:hypothetical protein